jgi:hypothetical protein
VVLLVLLYVITRSISFPESAHVLGAVDDLIVLSLGLFVAVRLAPHRCNGASVRECAAARPLARAALVGFVVLIVLAWQGSPFC